MAERARLPDKALVQDIAVGNVLAAGGAATVSRMACLHAGYPVSTHSSSTDILSAQVLSHLFLSTSQSSTALNTVNRQCSSGLASITQIANEISTGQIDIGIAAGVESMTMGYGAGAMPEKMSDQVTAVPEAADCLLRK